MSTVLYSLPKAPRSLRVLRREKGAGGQPAEDQEVFVVGGGSLGGSGWWADWYTYPVCMGTGHRLLQILYRIQETQKPQVLQLPTY